VSGESLKQPAFPGRVRGAHGCNEATLFTTAIATILLLYAGHAAAQQGPLVQRGERGFEVVVPPALQAAIEKRLPGFAFWTINDYGWGIPESYEFTMRQAPWAVVGDFDGDGFTDLVAEGHAGDRAYRICAWGGTREQNVLILEQSSHGAADTTKLGTVLEYVVPGTQVTNYSDEEMFIWTDAFLEYIWEKAGAIHYWEDGKFKLFASAD
jgi:hypothetical protein